MKTLEPTSHWEEGDGISQRAADFLERKRFGEWKAADEAELEAWLAESTLHRVAYLRLEGAVAHTRHLVALDPREFRASPWRSAGALLRRRFVPPLLAAASIALFTALGFPLVRSLMQPADRTYATDIGGRTTLKFADGTVADLDTDTVVRFRMTSAERTAWLERGEAWFHVSHNAASPFSVIIDRHRVTDLGTEFLVRRDSAAVEVALLTGRASLSTEGAAVATLRPGDDAVATQVSTSVTHKTPQELADELAWRRGILAFRKTRLADVVRAFNRYNAIKLVIADASIADEPISADLKTDDYESFLRIAEVALKLRVDRRGDEILISRAPRQEMPRREPAGHRRASQ